MILTAAVQRPGHLALPLPSNLRGGAATKVVGAMIAKGLLEEVYADKGDPHWHENGEGGGMTDARPNEDGSFRVRDRCRACDASPL